MMIDPAKLAFDFDGVLADTMALFLEIAREDYNINGIEYDDITRYQLDECLDINPEIIAEIIDRLLKGEYSQPLRPMAGAAEVMGKIRLYRNPLLLVTSRPYPGPLNDWMIHTLSLDPGSFEVIATGAADAKADELLNREIAYFVDDNIETCFSLMDAGITAILYRQPWNRCEHPFTEIGSWKELADLIQF
jgi:FMN phosphatase YigB (HAD superfamily)